jgi:DNA ligase-1
MSLELANFFKDSSSSEIQIISYMIQGRVAPMFVSSEFNYSEKSLINVLSNKYGIDVDSMRKESGDIGDTVFQIMESKKGNPKDLTLEDVYAILWKIVNTTGNGSISRKNQIILECLDRLSPLECKYFVRIICGELRLGLSVRSLLDVFSISIMGDKSIKSEIESAYGVCADIGYIGSVVLESNKENVVKNLFTISTQPGIPVLSRLVQRVGSFKELSERFKETVILQPKFDGLRCQIHKWEEVDEKSDNSMSIIWKQFKKSNTNSYQNLFEIDNNSQVQVKLFTRNLEDVTEMFPEIVDSAKKIKQTSFILDSEIVGWDYKGGKFLSYQETMQRRRKYSVQSMREDIPVRAFAFDLLYLNRKSLIHTDTKDRIMQLEKEFRATQESIVLAESKSSSIGSDIKAYFDKCVKDGLEGIIVKQQKGGYRPGVRNYEWIKIKKSIDKELVDTVDMVVVGYYKGSGRRSAFGLGAILGAIYNEKEDRYDAICKIGTGMSDEILTEINSKLEDIISKQKPKGVEVVDSLIPDVWVVPKYVITVDADEITKRIGEEKIGGGFSLRFPRLVEWDRDKSVNDVTTISEIEKMFLMRKSI